MHPDSDEPKRRLALFLATAGGAGYAPVAPGTFGSAVGVALYVPLSQLGPLAFFAIAIALLGAGIWASDEAERAFGQHDDGRIVIDEVVGQLLTLSPLVVWGSPEQIRSPLWVVTAFVVFRCLDIWKPGPVRRAERQLSGGTGVMMDDAVAGLLGAAGFAAALALWPDATSPVTPVTPITPITGRG